MNNNEENGDFCSRCFPACGLFRLNKYWVEKDDNRKNDSQSCLVYVICLPAVGNVSVFIPVYWNSL